MTQRAVLAVLGTVLVVTGCDSSGDDDGTASPRVIELTVLPDPCASKVGPTKVWCEWSDGKDLLATVYVDTGAEDAADYLQELSGGGQDLEAVDIEGAAAGWASMSDLEEFQVFYAAAELDGAVYAVEVTGNTGRVAPEAATRVVRAGMASLS